jgi:hypothetical protein
MSGLVLYFYGGHYYQKVRMVMWLRQAFREYDLPSIGQMNPEMREGPLITSSLDKFFEERSFKWAASVRRQMSAREPAGFQASEISEYLARKVVAAIMCIIGFPLLVVSLPLIFLAGLGLLIFGLGAILCAYGQHYWEKVTSIMWTRQALREYGAPTS